MLVLAYCARLRLGELARLNVGDVDLQSGTIIIRETKFSNPESCRGPTVIPRFLPARNLSADAAAARFFSYPKSVLSRPSNRSDTRYFVSGGLLLRLILTVELLLVQNCYQIPSTTIANLCTSAGLLSSHLHNPHTLNEHHPRHTYTWCKRASTSPGIALGLGHETIETTHIHADLATKERALQKVAQVAGNASRFKSDDALMDFLAKHPYLSPLRRIPELLGVLVNSWAIELVWRLLNLSWAASGLPPIRRADQYSSECGPLESMLCEHSLLLNAPRKWTGQKVPVRERATGGHRHAIPLKCEPSEYWLSRNERELVPNWQPPPERPSPRKTSLNEAYAMFPHKSEQVGLRSPLFDPFSTWSIS
jgi:hypothetical protein